MIIIPTTLDESGRHLPAAAGSVLTTVAAAKRLGGNALGLVPWSSFELQRSPGRPLRVTAVPAMHSPGGSDDVMGPAIGFVLSGEGLPTVYVTEDNASVEAVRAIVERVGRVDLAVLFARGVRVAERFDGAFLTLSSLAAVEVTRVLCARSVIPLHFEGWAHFSQGADTLLSPFEAA